MEDMAPESNNQYGLLREFVRNSTRIKLVSQDLIS
jgi:hypothetical protein